MHLIYSDSGLSTRDETPSIFLAGPSPRGYVEGHPNDWRDDTIPMFERLKFEGKLFIPRPSNGHMENYLNQVEWELHHLEIANVILFWVPRKYPEMKGMTTNVEFGMWAKDPKVIYGRPDWAEQTRYLDHIYKKYLGRNPHNDLLTLVECAKGMTSMEKYNTLNK